MSLKSSVDISLNYSIPTIGDPDKQGTATMSGEDEAIPQAVPGAHPQPPAQVAAVQLKLPPF